MRAWSTSCRPRLAALGAVALLAACGGRGDPSVLDETPEPPSREQVAISEERVEVLAPIETAEIIALESAPPQYAVLVVSGLPSGCAEFERIDTERLERLIELTVWNTMPADENVVCTMIYRTTQNTVELGSDFAPNQTYTVIVNGEETVEFTAQ